MLLEKELRIRISEKQEDKLNKVYAKSEFEKFSQFARHLIFNISLPQYEKLMDEKIAKKNFLKKIFVTENGN